MPNMKGPPRLVCCLMEALAPLAVPQRAVPRSGSTAGKSFTFPSPSLSSRFFSFGPSYCHYDASFVC